MYINIEVKTPYNADIKSKYNYLNSIQAVYRLICQYELFDSCCVSSFDRDVINEIQRLVNIGSKPLDIIHLYNFYDHMELPCPDEYLAVGSGINISATKLTKEVIDLCHAKGMKVGVWVDASVFQENDCFYYNLFELKVDFFVTDYPLQVMQMRDQWIIK